MKKIFSRNSGILIGAFIFSIVAFVLLYEGSKISVETVENEGDTTFENWDITNSAMNGLPLEEDKGIYSAGVDSNIYDVYISVFPTKDEDGDMIDFSAFSLVQALDHTYNPTLNCNIQILNEGENIDLLTNLDSKNATIRVRGNSARGDIFKSYKIIMTDEADPFYGQTTLNLNKHTKDITKIATKLQTDLLAQMDDMVSYRTYFMRVWVRDTSKPVENQEFEYYGLYTQIEQPNKAFLELRGLSSNASLYKAEDFSFNLADALKNIDDPEYLEEEFETVLSIREGSDHTKLLEMLKTLNDEQQNFEEVFYTYFNEENYLTWLAFNILMGNNDIINHNFMLYNPGNSQTWYFIPWDFDKSLRFGEYKESIPFSLRGIQSLNQSILHRRYLRMDGSIEKIQEKMEELLATDLTREKVEKLINSYKPTLEKTLLLYPDIGLLDDDMTPSIYNTYLDNLYDGILENYDNFLAYSKYPSPMFISNPTKNQDGTLNFTWDVSHSYQGLPVTYNINVYSDYNMQNMLLEVKNIAKNSYDSELKFSPGTYYVKITSVDSEGHEQINMERYESTGLVVFGLREFTIE